MLAGKFKQMAAAGGRPPRQRGGSGAFLGVCQDPPAELRKNRLLRVLRARRPDRTLLHCCVRRTNPGETRLGLPGHAACLLQRNTVRARPRSPIGGHRKESVPRPQTGPPHAKQCQPVSCSLRGEKQRTDPLLGSTPLCAAAIPRCS